MANEQYMFQTAVCVGSGQQTANVSQDRLNIYLEDEKEFYTSCEGPSSGISEGTIKGLRSKRRILFYRLGNWSIPITL